MFTARQREMCSVGGIRLVWMWTWQELRDKRAAVVSVCDVGYETMSESSKPCGDIIEKAALHSSAETLNLSFTGTSTPHDFEDVLSKFTNVTCLSVSYAWIASWAITNKIVTNILARNKVKTLTINTGRSTTPVDYEFFDNAVAKCEGMDVRIKSKDMTLALATCLSKLKGVRTLHVDLTTESLDGVCNSVAYCPPHIETLTISLHTVQFNTNQNYARLRHVLEKRYKALPQMYINLVPSVEEQERRKIQVAFAAVNAFNDERTTGLKVIVEMLVASKLPRSKTILRVLPGDGSVLKRIAKFLVPMQLRKGALRGLSPDR